MQLQLVSQIARLSAKVPAFVFEVARKVIDDVTDDGHLDPDTAEATARAASAEAGDLLKLKVKGVDVVDEDAQADLAAFVARVTVALVEALRPG